MISRLGMDYPSLLKILWDVFSGRTKIPSRTTIDPLTVILGNEEQQFIDSLKSSTSDQKMFESQQWKDLLLASLHESYRQGTSGNFQELLLASRFWGFSPESVSVRV